MQADWRNLRDLALEIEHRLRVDGAALEKACAQARDDGEKMTVGDVGNTIFSKATSVLRDMKLIREMLQEAERLAGLVRDLETQRDHSVAEHRRIAEQHMAKLAGVEAAHSVCVVAASIPDNGLVSVGRDFIVPAGMLDSLVKAAASVASMPKDNGEFITRLRALVEKALEENSAQECPWCRVPGYADHAMSCPFSDLPVGRDG